MPEQLNDKQRLAVYYRGGPLMILAGAGTGKTKVITNRIAELIKNGMAPEAIVALSFTNKAAREMRERIQLLSGKKALKVFCGTFHSYCLTLLRRFHTEAGLEKHFGLVGSSDQLELLKKALDHSGFAGLLKPEEIQQKISRLKNALLKPQDLSPTKLLENSLDPADLDILLKVYPLYEQQLYFSRVIDFDDCILKVHELLSAHEDLRSTVALAIKEWLVDEFQDTNLAQLKVIYALAKDSKAICVVGDDDQSIYSWRGALVETMFKFKELFSPVELIKLEQNYRCTNRILKAAHSVIEVNSQRLEKVLWSAKATDHPIHLKAFPNEESESKWIAQKCFGLLGQGLKPQNISVLFRTNSQARHLEESFREHNLSYRVVGGSSFFDRREVRLFLAYLKLIANPSDHLAFFRAVNDPPRGIGLKTLELIDAQTRRYNCSPFMVIQRDLLNLGPDQSLGLNRFSDLILELRTRTLLEARDFRALGETVLDDFGLRQEVLDKTKDPRQKQWKLELLGRLPLWLAQLFEQAKAQDKPSSLVDILDRLALSEDFERKEDEDHKISLITIHAAKGLEWPVVFIIGLEEELLPHKNSALSPQGLAEERRLLYVAMTRAKEHLYLSYTHQRQTGFHRTARKRCRFIEDVDQSLLTFEDHAQAELQAEQNKEEKIKRLEDFASRLLKEDFKPRHQ